MASQTAQANQDLNRMATAKYTKAAQVGLQGYQDAVNKEAEIAGINLQNQVARAQVMQQLGQVGGYAAGRSGGSLGTYGSSQPPAQSSYNGYVGDYNYNPNRMNA